MKSASLRTRLSIWAAAVFGLILSIFGAGVALHLDSQVIHSLRKRLNVEADAFFQIWQEHSHDLSWKDVFQVQSEFRDAPVFHPFEVYDPDGKSLYRSFGFGGMSLKEVSMEPGFYQHTFAGRKYEVGVYRRDNLTLKIVGDRELVDAVGLSLASSFASAGLLMLLVGSLGSWWLLRRAFRPVDEIVAAAEQITAQRLHERLPMPTSQDEISRLTVVLNRMMDRLEASFHQANRFTADASHELKTPLTIIRTELELQIRKHTIEPETQEAFVSLLEQTTRLTSIIEKLLLLSRADAGQLPVRFARFSLSDMLQNLAEDAGVLGSDLELAIHADIPPAIFIAGDRELIHQLLLNLIDNAVKYNRPGGSIWLRLLEKDQRVEISIGNTGITISTEESRDIFRRFHRGAQPRGFVAGQGLGLSLCLEIALAHRGSIRLANSKADRTDFLLYLPRDPEHLENLLTSEIGLTGFEPATS